MQNTEVATSHAAPRCAALTATLLLALLPAFGAAQDNLVVVESLTDADGPAQATGVTPGTGRVPTNTVQSLDSEIPFQQPVVPDASGLEEEYQIQLLQQEVSDLRGLIEELKYAVDMTRRLSDDRYLELDSRFQALRESLESRSGAPAGSVGFPGASPTPETPDAAPTDPERRPAVPGESSEQSLYDTALELIRNRQYDVAITQLEAVIAQYPEGELAPNAYYWLGEVYAAMPEPNFEQARQALAQVIRFFPEHSKVPAAAFKLGKVYHLMGDCTRAVEMLQGVIADNPGKSVGKLAEAYLRDKVDCGRAG